MISEVVKVGDEIVNNQGATVKVDSVECGEYGILVQGRFINHPNFIYKAFLPYELPANEEEVLHWYGWEGKSRVILSNDKVLASVCFSRADDPRPHTIEEYDKYMKETWELIAKENNNEQGDRPREE